MAANLIIDLKIVLLVFKDQRALAPAVSQLDPSGHLEQAAWLFPESTQKMVNLLLAFMFQANGKRYCY